VLFWAAAEGLRRRRKAEGGRRNDGIGHQSTGSPIPHSAFRVPSSLAFARFAAACALVSGIWSGKSPLSVAFYDGHTYTRAFGRVLYAPWPNSPEQVRVQYFEKLFALIPSDARVAATDFVRPRFTHHRECHQYGDGGLKPHVKPESIDYIVIDLTGPYSDWVQGHRLRELDEDPAHWEVMHWDPIGELFFHVIRAKREPESVSDRE
jgi:hypothetical protein